MNSTSNSGEQLQQYLFKRASIARRMGAFCIDHVIMSFTSFVFALPLLIFSTVVSEQFIPIIRVLIVSTVGVLIYGFRDIFKGRSIGKIAFGIGVRDAFDNHAVPSISRLFLRQIFTFIWPVEFLVLVFNREQRKIGDIIAGTGVYNLREYDDFIQSTKRMEYITQGQIQDVESLRPPATEPYRPGKKKIVLMTIGVLLAGAVLIFALIFGVSSGFRNHPSYHLATDYIRANPEIAAAIGEVEGFGFIPTGSISTGPGRGDANFVIIVRGIYGDARVFIELQMRCGGDWEVVEFAFTQIY